MQSFPKISSAFLNLTDACNLRCTYCWCEKHPNFMSYQVAKDSVDFLAENGKQNGKTPQICFFGGEPLLMWDKIIEPLTNYIREKYGDSFGISITSNCILMDEKKAEFMQKNKIDLLFSIDGDEYSQNTNRPFENGKGSFDVLKDKIPIILKYFPTVTFRGTITPKTAEYLFHNFMFAEKCGFQNVFFMPNCFENWDKKYLEILKNQLRFYSDHYIDCFRKNKNPIFFSQLEKQFSKIVLNNKELKENTFRCSKSCLSCGKCGLGSGSCAGININGDITACQEFFSKDKNIFYIGNIYSGVDDNLRQSLCDLYDKTPSYSKNCNTCKLNRICDGGCVANNHMITGNINNVPEVFCFWSELLFNESIYIMQTLGTEMNEKFKSRWSKYVR